MNQTNPSSEIKGEDSSGAGSGPGERPARRPRLLYLLHCYHNRGGTEEHTRTLARELAGDFDISIVFPEDGRIVLFREGKAPVPLPGAAVPWPLAPYRSPIIEQSLNNVLKLVDPDLIHIQHFFNWPLGVIEQLAATKKPVLMTYHDYYVLTPHYTMERVFDPHETITERYSKMVFRTDISSYLAQRRKIIERSLSKLTAHIVPAPYAGREIGKIYPMPFQVIEHGIQHFDTEHQPSTDDKLRFGFVGSLLPQKGWVSLINAFTEIAAETDRAELHFYGGNALHGKDIPGVTFHGVYEQSELPRILSTIDVGIIPSIFPETFSLVLSELWMAGLPVCVSDIGALGDRVTHLVNGYKYAAGDSNALAQALRWFLADNTWRQWTIPKPREIPAMIEDYRKLYRRHLPTDR